MPARTVHGLVYLGDETQADCGTFATKYDDNRISGRVEDSQGNPITVPDGWRGRVLLEADAVSYDATVRVNGKPAGAHRGLWAPFQLDVTALVQGHSLR